jgi:hypothetical protein
MLHGRIYLLLHDIVVGWCCFFPTIEFHYLSFLMEDLTLGVYYFVIYLSLKMDAKVNEW